MSIMEVHCESSSDPSVESKDLMNAREEELEEEELVCQIANLYFRDGSNTNY
jgi:hypothetical protein